MPLTARACALTSYAAARATARALSGAACLVVALYAFGAIDEACRAYAVRELSRRLGTRCRVEELESTLVPGGVRVDAVRIEQPAGFEDVARPLVHCAKVTCTFAPQQLVKRRLVVTSCRVQLLQITVVRHKSGVLNVSLLDPKRRTQFNAREEDDDWEHVPQIIDAADDFLGRVGEAPGLYNDTAHQDAERLKDEGLRLWGKLRAATGAAVAKAVESTKSWEDAARQQPSALEDLGLRALSAGRSIKRSVEDEFVRKRNWAAEQARAALLERLEKAPPDEDDADAPPWLRACLAGAVTFDRVELTLAGSGVLPGAPLVVGQLIVDGSDLGALSPRPAARLLAKRLAEAALDALLHVSPADVLRLAAVVGAVTAAEAERAVSHAARDAANRARGLADAAAREADARTREFGRELAGYDLTPAGLEG